jgi:LacI family transcriptional regulator
VKVLNIRDVARLSKVSVSTVSRVINDHPDVSPETKDRVRKIIAEEGYVPNTNARHLKLIREKQVGLIVKGLFNPFFARIVEIMEKELTRSGYATLLHYSQETKDDIDILLEKTLEQHLGGLVYLGGDFDAPSLRRLKTLNIPVVLTSADFPWEERNADFSSVTIDNVQVAFEAVSALGRRGLKKIAMLSPRLDEGNVGRRRIQGYEKALSAFELPLDPTKIVYGDYTMASGYASMGRLLKRHPDVEGVFAASDQIALGAAKYCLDQGIAIPGEISIIGVDGIDCTRYYHPRLATMAQPMAEFAGYSLELLMKQMEGGEPPRRHIRLETTLIEGESMTGGTP